MLIAPRLWLPCIGRRARGSASTSAHQSSEESSCGCDHERWTTAWRACSIAVTSRDTSGRLTSSRAKLAALIRGGSPEGQRGLPHAPDVRIDEVQRSLASRSTPTPELFAIRLIRLTAPNTLRTVCHAESYICT